MKYILMSFFAALIVFGYGKNLNSHIYQDFYTAKDSVLYADSSIEGQWQLMPVLASDTASGRLPSINFDLADNKFMGNTGCNTMSGSFVRNADSLVFSDQIITTKMNCTGYNEKAFLENLLRVRNYSVENGVLQLMEGQTTISKWVRKGSLKKLMRKA